MVPNAWQVPDSPAANGNHTVLLQIVVNAWNVSGNFLAIGQPNAGDFSQSGIRLLGRLSPYNQTHSPFLG